MKPKQLRFRSRSFPSHVSFCFGFAVSVFASTGAFAQLTWNNAGPSDNWSTAPGNENWTGGVVWTDGQDAIFGATPETVTPTTVNVVDDISFGGSWTIANGSAASINLTTDGASDITVDPTFTTTIAEVLSGTNTVTKLGTGTLVLSGANTFSNGLTISAGTVSSTVAGGFGTGTVTVGPAGTANFNFGANANVTNIFTGSGTISATGAFTPTLTSAAALNTFTGTLNVNTTGGGKFVMNAVGSNIGSGAIVNIAAGATLYLPITSTISGVTFNIAGNGNTENLGALRLEGATIDATSSIVAGGNIQLGGNNVVSTINAAISETGGSRSVEKLGTGTLKLGGNNTYTGKTTVTGGTLQFTKTASLYGGTAANWTASNINVKNGAALGLNIGGAGEFSVSDLDTLLANLSVASSATTGMQAGSSIALDTTNAVGGSVTQGNIIANSTGANGGAIGLIKLGTGTLVLDKANTFTGAINVAGGTLTLSNTVGANTANGNFRVGTVANTKATLNITSGATLNRFNLFVGDAGAGTGGGAVYQSGGTLTLTQGAGIDNLRIGSNAGGYGYYSLSGGSLTSNEVGIGASLNGTTGVMDITGGTFTTGVVAIGRGGTTSSGVLNALGGTVVSTRIQLNSAGNAGASSVLTVGGGSGAAAVGTTGSTTLGLDLASGNTAGTLGVANLRTNGTLTTGIVTATNANPTALLNFNGGTLKATATNAGVNFISANVDAVTVYSNGGTIDNSGTNISINKGLTGATGNGVTSVAVTNGGSGYIGAPLVTITGGTGNTATGYAVMVDDGTGNGTYKVGSIVITSPGSYTVDPTTVTLTGGGAATAATVGAITTAANTSGGMTFAGSGTTILTGANTYSGPTIVSAGTLQVNAGLSATSGVSVASGATFSGAGVVNGITTIASGGALINSNASTPLTLGGLTFSGPGTISFNKSGTTSDIVVTGALTTGGGPIALKFLSAPAWSTGTYNLLTYGSLVGSFSDFTLNPADIVGLSSRQSATLGNSGNTITLNITGDTIVWSGAGGGTWTTAPTNNNAGPNNWATKTAHTPTNFWVGDGVEFADTYDAGAGATAPTTTNVVITGGVAPSSVLFSNSVLDYTISSSDSTGITAGSVVKGGTKTATINTNNSYNGSTTVNAGALILNGNNTGNGAFIVNAGSLVLNGINSGSGAYTLNAGTLDLNGNNTGSGAFNVNGGTFTVTGTNANTSAVTIASGGTLQMGNGGTTGLINAAAGITNNGTLIFNHSNALAQGTDFFTAGINGTGAVIQNGTGTVTFNTTNGYSGGTTINSGAISISADNQLGGGPVTLNGGALTTTNTTALTNTHVFTIGAAGGTLNILGTAATAQNSRVIFGTANTLLGSGTLTVNGNGALSPGGGAGALVLNQSNTYSGNIILQNGGMVEYANATSVGAAATFTLGVNGGLTTNQTVTNAISVTGSGSVLSFNGNNNGNFSGAINLNGNTLSVGLRDWYNYATARNGLISGVISGTGGISVDPGTSATPGTLTLTGTNTYSGTTTILTGATLQLGNGTVDGTIAATSGVTNNGTLVYNWTTGHTASYVISGTGGVNKLGAGTATLTGANTYNGVTNVNVGALNIQNATALGSTTGGTTVATGAALEIQGGIIVGAETLTLNGTGIANGGALRNISGINTFGGAITLASASRINSDAGTLTLSGAIGGAFGLTVGGGGNTAISGVIGTGAGTLTKDGTGTLTLTGTNTYSGVTTITAGTLQLGDGTTDGTIANTTSVINNGTLAYNWVADHSVGYVISGTGAVTKTGAGTATFTGANTYTGATTINGGRILVNGSLANTAVTINAGGALGGKGSIAGLVTASAGAAQIDLRDNSIGTLTLSGGLTLNSGNVLHFDFDSTTSTVDTIAITGGAYTFASGTASIDINTLGAGTPNIGDYNLITLGGTATGSLNASNFSLTNPTVGGLAATLSSTGNALKMTLGSLGSGDATAYWKGGASGTWAVGNFSLASDGTGIVTSIQGNTDVFFSASSPAPVATLTTLTADTAVKSLTVLSSQTGSVGVGGSQKLIMGPGGITLQAGAGALTLSTNEVALNGIQTWQNNSSSALTVSAPITGTGYGLKLSGTGNGGFFFSGANTYDAGTTIGDATFGPAVLHLTGTGSLLSTGAVTIGTNSTLDIASHTGGTAIGTLNTTVGATGASILLGANTLTINQSAATTFAGIFSGTGGLTKQGTGTLTLTGASTYSGLTTITTGALNIQNAAALGTAAAGTTVASGAALEIQGGITVAAEALTLNGTGVSNGGALRNISGTNTYGGAITLATASRINSDAGTLTISGAIGGSGLGLTVGGAGNTTISSVIGTGTGTLTKDGTGTLVLTGANTYTGTTTISAGTLQLGNGGTTGSLATSSAIVNNGNLTFNRSNAVVQGTDFSGAAITGTGSVTQAGTGTTTLNAANTYSGLTTVATGTLNIQNATALGSTTGGTTVASGAALAIQSGITVGAEALTLNGTGIANGGALRNISGNNTFGGAITLASASRINSDAGLLTLSGAITGSGLGLTVGGAGNTTVSGAIATDAGTLTKDGTGTLTLSGANTYTGATAINGGKLDLTGSLAGTAVTVGGSGTLSGTGTIAGSVTLSTTGSQIDLRNGSVGTLSIGGGLTLHTGNVLSFDLGTTAGSSDRIALTGGTYTFTDPGTASVNIQTLGAASLGNYDLITGAAGMDATKFTLTSNFIGGRAATLNSSSGNALTLVLTVAAGDATAYWKGGASGNWDSTNFSTAANGTGTVGAIGNATDVFFSATTPAPVATSTTLAFDQSVKSLTVLSNQTGSVGIGGTGALHIGTGLTAQAGAGALTINTAGGVVLDGVQTWTNNSTNAVTIGTTMSGSALTLTGGAGNGGFVFSGATTYAGGTAINGTKLTLTGAGSLLDAGPVNLGANGSLDISGITASGETIGALTGDATSSIALGAKTLTTGTSASSTHNGTITGTGGVTKQGTGTLTLGGVNTYTGTTAVNEGTLEIVSGGSTLGATTVASGAILKNNGILAGTVNLSGTLSGIGTVQGLTTTNSGSTIQLSDGTINTITLSGGLNLANNSAIRLDIGTVSGSVDHIDLASGLFTGNGVSTISLNQLGNLAAGTYTLISNAATDSLNASYFTLASVTPGFTSTLTSDGESLVLTLSMTSFVPLAQTPNQQQVAAALEEVIANPGNYSPDFQNVIAALVTLTPDQAAAAFDQISPAFHSGALTLAGNLSQSTASSLFQTLSLRSINSVDYSDPYAGDYLWDLWGQASGYFSDGGMSLIPGEDFKSGTYLVGANRNLTHNTSIGIFGGYGDGTGEFADNSSIDLERQFIGGYLTYVNGGFYANAAVGGGNIDYDSKRRIQFGTLDRTATGTTSGQELFVVVGGGYDFKFGDFTVGPQASIQRSSVKLDGFNETGASSLNLGLEDTEYTSLRSQVGGRMTYTLQTESVLAIVPFVQTFWQHEYEDSQGDINSKLDGGNGPAFSYTPTQGDQDSFILGAGLSFDIGETFQATFSYNRDSGNGGSDLMSATANFKF